MTRLFGLLFVAVTFALFLDAAGAQDTAKKVGKLDVDAIFKKLDTNNDGILSKDEFLKLCDRYRDKDKARDKLTVAYEKIDPKAKGISKDQFRKYIEAIEAARKKDDQK